VPGFEPSPETFAVSLDDMREDLTESVRRGELRPGVDTDDGVRLLTVVLSGVISQQLTNEPGMEFADGAFSRLTGEALDLFFDHYRPERSPDANPGP